eukprot:11465179-Alexandrium_andersonii.AAC.1
MVLVALRRQPRRQLLLGAWAAVGCRTDSGSVRALRQQPTIGQAGAPWTGVQRPRNQNRQT